MDAAKEQLSSPLGLMKSATIELIALQSVVDIEVLECFSILVES